MVSFFDDKGYFWGSIKTIKIKTMKKAIFGIILLAIVFLSSCYFPQ